MPSLDQLQQFQAAAPATITVLWAVALVLGLVLWLSGKRLARPACAVSGLLLGGLAGLTLGQMLAEEGAMALPLMIGAAVIGAIVATFMFRVWMALSGAMLLAVVIPAASMIWLGTVAPPEVATAGESITIKDAAGDASGDASGGGLWAQAQEAARAIYEQQADLLTIWWNDLGTSGRTFIMVSALIGAVGGLLLGLILPDVSAALQSSAIGAVLIFFAGRELLWRYLPDQTSWLPATPRQVLLTLGLITLGGLAIQGMLFRRGRMRR